MISLIVPYILTFMGLITDAVHDFPEFAIFLTAIGVLWTGLRAFLHDYGIKGVLAFESGHAIIWILCRVFPVLFAKLMGFLGGVLAVIILLVMAYFYFEDEDGSTVSSSVQNTRSGAVSMPNIIYDSSNNRWQCVGRFGSESEYRSDDGQTVRIYHADVSGSGANTSAGYFHWY